VEHIEIPILFSKDKMDLKKTLTTALLSTSLVASSFSQQEKYSLSFGASYMIPKKELRGDFNSLKGIEVGFEKPINQKSSLKLNYCSGYRWGKQIDARELEPKINADELSIFYNHKISTSSKIKPFYGLGIGYERFKLGTNKDETRIIEKTDGETLGFEIGANFKLNKKDNKELYIGIKKEFFIPNKKTEEKYSNIRFTLGINFKRISKKQP
jgi:hypothetical protein